jgi:cytoskeletal protein CcmA (bactofilin family)
MGLKENFNQAMRDLLNRGGLVGSEKEEKVELNSDLDSYLDFKSSDTTQTHTYIGSPASTAPNNIGASNGSGLYDQESDNFTPRTDDPKRQSPTFERQASSFRPDTNSFPNNPAFTRDEYGKMFRPAEEMTLISKNTMIIGDIKTLASITIEGKVRGQIDALKDANINGMLIGDLTCNNSDIRGSSIQGNVTTKGSTYIDNDSILLGDITAQFASIDGKVKGNIDISSKVELRHNAIVAGNINTNTISIEDGANIRGYVNTTFLKEHGDSAFPNSVVINNESAE